MVSFCGKDVKTMNSAKFSLRDMALCALFAAILTISAWITVPVLEIAFTMQTFAVFLTLGLLGGKRGTITIAVYLLLGAVGAPVFSGFRGGVGALLGVTGGYLAGFLFSALVYWLITACLGEKAWVRALGMVVGLLVCYAFGSAWFLMVYVRGGGVIGLGAVLMKCVVPYLIPDAIKLALAFVLTLRLQRYCR